MRSSTQLDTTAVVLLLLGAVLLLPLLAMGMGAGMMGYGGMMGEYGTTVGWWPLVGVFVRITFLLVLLGGGYLVARRLTDSQTARSSALEELRQTYARGDLTDDEFERRRAKLVDDES